MFAMSQMVTFPTRLNNTLDVFLTNRTSLVNRCEPIPGVNYHDAAVYVNSDIVPKSQRPVQKKIHIWKKADTELEDLAAFAEEKQTRYNPDTPVEILWALFQERFTRDGFHLSGKGAAVFFPDELMRTFDSGMNSRFAEELLKLGHCLNKKRRGYLDVCSI